MDVKNKINYIEGSFPYEFYLQYNKIKLEETKTIDYYNIKRLCTLDLINCPFTQIFVKTLTGKSLALNVQGSNTILYIKEQIENITGINASEQKLLYKGNTLEANKTIDFYYIREDPSVFLSVKLLLRLRGG